LPRTRLMLG